MSAYSRFYRQLGHDAVHVRTHGLQREQDADVIAHAQALAKKRADDAKKNKLKVTPSTGNVFRDLGFSAEESERLLVRADLLLHLQKALAARALTQARAARLLHVTQPRVSDLLRGASISLVRTA